MLLMILFPEENGFDTIKLENKTQQVVWCGINFYSLENLLLMLDINLKVTLCKEIIRCRHDRYASVVM